MAEYTPHETAADSKPPDCPTATFFQDRSTTVEVQPGHRDAEGDVTSETTRKARISLAPAKRRQQLLDAARAIILQNNSVDLTVERITNAAKMAKGTFYLYFDSKDHLLGCLWDNYVNGLIDQAQRLIGDAMASGWAAAIDISVQQMVHYDMENAALHQVMLEQASRDALGLFDQSNQKILELLRVAVLQGVADGSFRVRNPEMRQVCCSTRETACWSVPMSAIILSTRTY